MDQHAQPRCVPEIITGTMHDFDATQMTEAAISYAQEPGCLYASGWGPIRCQSVCGPGTVRVPADVAEP